MPRHTTSRSAARTLTLGSLGVTAVLTLTTLALTTLSLTTGPGPLVVSSERTVKPHRVGNRIGTRPASGTLTAHRNAPRPNPTPIPVASPTLTPAPVASPTLTPAPVASPTPTLAPAASPTSTPAPPWPADLLDLRGWKLTLPVAATGSTSAREVAQPELSTFAMDPWFTTAAGAVQFRANAGGATTSGSSYPRSELREMSPDGTTKASWSTSSGTHTLVVRAAATHLPVAKPQVVMAQVHDASNDIIEIVADGTRVSSPGTHSICVRLNGSTLPTCLDNAYVPGTFVTLQISVHDGRIVIAYNGTTKLDLAATATGCYFKAGAYTQSNTSKGEAPEAYGEVRISALHVTHSVT